MCVCVYINCSQYTNHKTTQFNLQGTTFNTVA